MTIRFDHTIIPSADKERSATFYAEIFGLPTARTEGPFAAVDMANDVALYIAGWHTDVTRQHYAFLVSEDEFTAIYGRILERGMEHWADAKAHIPGEINHDDGGRGTYFRDPDNHYLEIITRRYGAGGQPAER